MSTDTLSDAAVERAPESRTTAWISVALTVLGYNLLLGIFVVIPSILLPMLGAMRDMRQITAVALVGTLAVELIALRMLIVWLRRSGRTLRDLGWRRSTTAGAVIGAIIFGAAYAGYTLMIPEVREHALEISLFKLLGVVVGVIAGVVEEIVFRGFVITELERTGSPLWVQVLVSGVTFGLIHIGFDLAGVLVTLAMGIVLALLYVMGRRSLTPVAIGHGLINAVIEPWLLLFIITMYAQMFGKG